MKKLLLLIAVGAFVISTSPCRADIPHLINYQGMLTDNGGEPLNGTFDLTFRIFNDSTDGTLKWAETQYGISVTNGLFNVNLGDSSSLDLPFDEDYWLEIEVGILGALSPRLRLTSVPWAYRAEIADTANYAVEAVIAESDSDWIISEDDMYSALSGDVGIGTSSPLAKLDVRGTLNVGTNGMGYDVNLYGIQNGSRLFWDESKMAFRVGRDTSGVQWTSDSVGDYSFAAGYNATASGEHSIAIGANSNASRPYSTAIGNRTDARGNYATALGAYVTASGEASSAMGLWNSASGVWSTALGAFADASGSTSVAIGYRVYADTNKCIVIGALPGSGAPIVNNIPYSLMVGFKGPNPTLFVDTANVGIGTTSPAQKLQVAGNVKVDDTLFASNVSSNSPLCLQTDGTTRMYIDDVAGNVGIGTTTPDYPLTIKGTEEWSVDQQFLKFIDWQGDDLFRIRYDGEAHGYLEFYDGSSGELDVQLGTDGAPTFFKEGGVGIGITNPTEQLDVNGTARLRGISDGTVEMTGVVVDANGVLYKELPASSIRYKKNIREIKINPEDILKLQTVRFEWKKSGKEDVGLIAEDVEKTVPDLVIYDDQGQPNGVRYNKLALYLLETVKELKAENDALKSRIEALESKE
jgi:hypothetical protein